MTDAVIYWRNYSTMDLVRKYRAKAEQRRKVTDNDALAEVLEHSLDAIFAVLDSRGAASLLSQ